MVGTLQGLVGVAKPRWYIEKSQIMKTLNLGTKETIVLTVTDRLGQTDDLSGFTNMYRVANEDDTDKVAWAAVTNTTGMDITLILDTHSGWTAGRYKLYARFATGTETPILGPFWFDLA